jgi:hypothetical protein
LKVTSAALPRQREWPPVSNGLPPLWPSCSISGKWNCRVISGKSKLAEAIRYATSRRKVLECFLTDGRVEIDSNIVERAIRPQTITRKNALFAGSDGGGRTWANIATLLQTAKMNDVDPLTWLALTLQRIANGWPISQIEKLMPWNYKA